jgi:hypothetical protein
MRYCVLVQRMALYKTDAWNESALTATLKAVQRTIRRVKRKQGGENRTGSKTDGKT